MNAINYQIALILILGFLLSHDQLRAQDKPLLDKLSPILGSWTTKATFKSGDDEHRPFVSEWTAKKILDANHISIESIDRFGSTSVKGLSIISHDRTKNELRMTIFSSFHPDPVHYRGQTADSVLTWTLVDQDQPNEIVMKLNLSNPQKLTGTVVSTHRASKVRQTVMSESVRKP